MRCTLAGVPPARTAWPAGRPHSTCALPTAALHAMGGRDNRGLAVTGGWWVSERVPCAYPLRRSDLAVSFRWPPMPERGVLERGLWSVDAARSPQLPQMGDGTKRVPSECGNGWVQGRLLYVAHCAGGAGSSRPRTSMYAPLPTPRPAPLGRITCTWAWLPARARALPGW